MLLKASLQHSNPIITHQVPIQNERVQAALEASVERGEGQGWGNCLSLW